VYQGLITGVFFVSEVAFSEFIEMYKPMNEVISKLSGLSIANARKFRTIRDNEKQLLTNKRLLTELNNTKDKLFSIIAHDLRGPVSSFFELSRLMVEEHHSMTESDIMEISKTMLNSSENLNRLLENLLEWAQMQHGTLRYEPSQFFLLTEILVASNLIMDPARKKSIAISYNIPDNLQCYADVHMFDTIIRNLISNAIKFTNKGGKIIISANIHDGDYLEIQFKDSGIGMSKDMLNKLFILNANTSRAGTEGEPSTGLGLLLCKEFIEKHNGKIWVESEEDQGTVFHVQFPVKSS